MGSMGLAYHPVMLEGWSIRGPHTACSVFCSTASSHSAPYITDSRRGVSLALNWKLYATASSPGASTGTKAPVMASGAPARLYRRAVSTSGAQCTRHAFAWPSVVFDSAPNLLFGDLASKVFKQPETVFGQVLDRTMPPSCSRRADSTPARHIARHSSIMHGTSAGRDRRSRTGLAFLRGGEASFAGRTL